MPGQALGRTVHHDMRPEFQRSLQDRRRERVIHDGADAGGSCGRKADREIGLCFKFGRRPTAEAGEGCPEPVERKVLSSAARPVSLLSMYI